LNSSGASKFSKALCRRYLAGILNIPGFWLTMSAMKLCGKMTEVLKDIGVDILTLGPLNEPESPLDHDGVDLLDTMILSGISTWFEKLD
jgi:hypothetical protein